MRRNGCTSMCSVEGMRQSSGWSHRWNWQEIKCSS